MAVEGLHSPTQRKEIKWRNGIFLALPFSLLAGQEQKKRATFVVTDGALRRPSEAPASLCSSPRAPKAWLLARRTDVGNQAACILWSFSRQTPSNPTNLDPGNCLLLVLVTLFEWQALRVRLSELLITSISILDWLIKSTPPTNPPTQLCLLITSHQPRHSSRVPYKLPIAPSLLPS